MTLRRMWIALGLAAAASACSGPPTLAPSDFPLRIVGLSPTAGATLSKGATESVRLTVASEAAGRLTLSVRDEAGTHLLSPETSVELLAGQETSIGAQFAIPPAASSIQVLARFRPVVEEASPAVIEVRYDVR